MRRIFVIAAAVVAAQLLSGCALLGWERAEVVATDMPG